MRDRSGRRLVGGYLGAAVATLAAVPPPSAWGQAASADPSPVQTAPRAAPSYPAATTVRSVTVKPMPPAPRPYGAVVGDIQPELQMTPEDIQSYGVSTVTDLLNEIAPQTRSDRGRSASGPVILLNGQRISSLNEVQNIPTEAIQRVDILPEEVALKYGYTADQRVVNIVLKRDFRAETAEAGGGETTEGGDPAGQAEALQFAVHDDTRTNFDLKYQAAGGLTDAQRGLAEPSGGPPFDLAGNVVSPTGGQIDPDLTALVGAPVLVAGVPAAAKTGQPLTLAEFVPTANLANVTDTSGDHSLVPATQSLTANAVVARQVFWGINATFNATLTGTTSDALQGLPGVGLQVTAGDPFSPFSQPVTVDRYVAGEGPLRQDIDGWTGHLGVAFRRQFGPWRLSLTSAYNHADTETRTGTGLDATGLQALLNQDSPTLDPFGLLPTGLLSALPQSRAHAVTDAGNIQLLANGPLLKLPAGDLYVSAKIGDVEAIGSSSTQFGPVALSQTLARNDVQGQLNFDLPIASREHHVFGRLGELSLNANTAIDDYSDFGALVTLGYGVNWTPIPGYNLIVSETHDHLAPTLLQLDGPAVTTPGVRLFDYATGQTAVITQITGGNPALAADDRRVIKVGLTLKPFPTREFTFTANYINSHIAGAIGSFPAATAAIEAAFPDRFPRDADGDLTEEDDRPLNFASQDREELRWGVNFSMPVGKQPPPRRPSPYGRGAYPRRRQGGPAGPGLPGFAPFASQAPGEGQGGGDEGANGPAGAPGSANGPSAGDNGPAGAQGRPGAGAGGFGAGYGGGGGFRGGGVRGGRGGGEPVGGRFQVALYHTVIFRDQYLVARTGPVLDLLNGAPAGGGGGQYQHEIEGQLGYTDNGYGLRLSADWRSATTVNGGAAGSTGTLNFSDVSTVNLRLWDDFSPQKALVLRYPLLNGVRVTFSVTNLFDQSIVVRDSAGPTPLVYQSAFLDPTGRVVSISLRKIFY